MRTAVGSPTTPSSVCPACASPAGFGESYCRNCGIWLASRQAAEIRWIDVELKRVDETRTWLISRRAVLLDELAGMRRQAATARVAPAADEAGAPMAPRRPEMSGRTAARLLLAAGAALVVIAVTIFTIADWAKIGPLGRSAILVGVTALVLAAPRPLIRRNLNATAEAVAAIGLALTIGDAYLLQRLITAPAGPLVAAAFCACLAAGWAAYGSATGLKGPRLAPCSSLSPPRSSLSLTGPGSVRSAVPPFCSA